MKIQRNAHKHLLLLAKKFRAVAVIGPRQSGKTTLCRMAFPNKPYVSLENPDTLQFAKNDPRGFLALYNKGAVIDEVQRHPELFSYLQQILDETKRRGLFILSGSNNFLLQQNIAQSLAGRIGYLTLLPFCFAEVQEANQIKSKWTTNAVRGFYPGVVTKKTPHHLWFPAYTNTYIERDVRQLKNIANLGLFTRFLRLCAGRAGQELNMHSMSNDCGIDSKTVQSWIGILESSFIIFLLKPYHKNFKKQVIKSPKLYFYDTGLLCFLLGINTDKQLESNSAKGAVFENMIIAEKLKQKENIGAPENFFFWRDKTGNEVDLITETGSKINITEIKAGETIQPEFWKTLLYFEKLAGKPLEKTICYGGKEIQQRSGKLTVKGWSHLI